MSVHDRLLGLGLLIAFVAASMFVVPASKDEVMAAEGRHMMEPRVPADKLDEARALVNPLPDSPEVVERGKAIYEGKGTCVNCHGVKGGGDGPGGLNLDPPPRNFRHHGLWRHRTEGELFWVIKYGSPGTGMIPFGGLLSDDDIWAVLRYERRFASHGGQRRRGCCDGERRLGPGMGKGRGRHGMMKAPDDRGRLDGPGCCGHMKRSP